MAELDPNIILQTGQYNDPQKLMSLQVLAQQLKERQQAAQNQNALRSLLAKPGAIDPNTGLPTAATTGAIAQTGNIDEAVQIAQARAQEDLKRQQAQEKRQSFVADMQHDATEGALSAYDDAISQGLPPTAAQDKMQQYWTQFWDEKGKSGLLHPEEMPHQTSPSVDFLRNTARSYQDYRASQQAKEAEQERLATEKERERHDVTMEGLIAQRQASLGGAAGSISDDTLDFMADQYLAGDKSVLQNLGRGTQGAQTLLRLRGKIAQRAAEKGETPEQVAATMAQFEGFKAAERATGTRTAVVEMAVNEADQFADLALKASKQFPRTEFVPVNRALQSWARNTGDPAVVAFGAANNSFINAYARAVNPTGASTVSDKEHAREMLETAQSDEQYEAVIKQLRKEMAAARKAPTAVRGELRETFAPQPDTTRGTSASEITSKQQYDALPSGAHYRKPGDPADKVRIKP